MTDQINIIVVDDNPPFLEGLSSYLLKNDKYNVMVKLTSGIELLKYNDVQYADLILMDIEMPELNGIETAIRLNYLHPHIKLIAITMYQDKVYLEQLISAGFKGFINKAKVPEGLFDTIEAVMGNQFIFPANIKL